MTPTRFAPLTVDVLRASWREWLSIDSPRVGPAWLRIVWTTLFSATLAVGFTLFGFALNARTLADWLNVHQWALWFGRNLVVSLVIGFIIHGLFTFARLAIGAPRLGALTGWRRGVFFSAVPMLGVLLGWPLGVTLIYGNLSILDGVTPSHVLSMVVLSSLISGLIFMYFALRHRELRAEMRANDAQLRLLQGQMEPHFLFNTLANVISLIDADAPRAKEVLEAFTEYLRASLGSLRRTDSTLGAEVELATRYLHLMHTRMGERLRFEFDVPPELRGAALPPLMLQPLVENAVKHGLEPQVAGGTVRVQARAVDAGGLPSVQLCVEDDGVGLEAAARRRRGPARATDGNGVALANLHERLRSVFGGAASLALVDAPSGSGTRACLVLPLRTPSRAAR